MQRCTKESQVKPSVGQQTQMAVSTHHQSPFLRTLETSPGFPEHTNNQQLSIIAPSFLSLDSLTNSNTFWDSDSDQMRFLPMPMHVNIYRHRSTVCHIQTEKLTYIVA